VRCSQYVCIHATILVFELSLRVQLLVVSSRTGGCVSTHHPRILDFCAVNCSTPRDILAIFSII
jgi:hypothetical protein